MAPPERYPVVRGRWGRPVSLLSFVSLISQSALAGATRMSRCWSRGLAAGLMETDMFHRSERLLLRPGWIEDASEVTAQIADRAIVRNLARVPWPYREEHARSWLAAQSASSNDVMLPTFLMTLPDETGSQIIGCCGLHEGRDGGVDIGYWLGRNYWGHGFATEAARAVLAVAQTLGHDRVFGRHAVDNPASGRVMRNAGFVPTGRMANYFSMGRNTEVVSLEYVAILDESADDGDPSHMKKAA